MPPSCALAGADATRCGEGRAGRLGRRRRFIGPPLRRIARVADLQRLRLSVRPPARAVPRVAAWGPAVGRLSAASAWPRSAPGTTSAGRFAPRCRRGIFGASWAGRFVCRGSVVGLVGLGVCGPVSKKSGDELRRRSPSGNRRAAPPNGPSFPSVNPAAARGPDPLEFVKRIVAWGGFGRSTACLGPGFWDSAPIPPPETAPLAELSGPIPDLFGETTYAQSRRR